MTIERPILEARNLQVLRGGVPVLAIPELTINERQVLSLIGPNGAGKSTLLLALTCLIQPSMGNIFFRGQRITSHHDAFSYRRKLAMVFQEPLLFDTTVFENVAAGLKIRGMKKHEYCHAVEKSLDRFGISHLTSRSAVKLSGGEAQRTSLARAFALEPEIIFLDEPFSSLDPPTRSSLIDDLERILRETKTTAVITTHDQMEAMRLSDQIAVMDRGKILQTGIPSEIMNNPVDECVAAFVGMETALAGDVIRSYDGSFIVSVSGREVEAVGTAAPGDSVICFVRPENVTITTGGSGDATSARNRFPGKITRVTPAGLFHKIHLDCGFPLVAYITNISVENLSLVPGKDVTASFKATGVHVIKK